jgi:hypothetical protein
MKSLKEATFHVRLPDLFSWAQPNVAIISSGGIRRVYGWRAQVLADMYGTTNIAVTGADIIDVGALLYEDLPRCFFHVGRHLELSPPIPQLAPIAAEPDLPPLLAQRRARSANTQMRAYSPSGSGNHVHYLFAKVLPHRRTEAYGMISLTHEFLSRPELPDFKSSLPESEHARITYFAHALPDLHDQLCEWMLRHPRELVGVLQEIKELYNRYRGLYLLSPLPREIGMFDYRADLAITFGEWSRVGGAALIAALRQEGALPFMRDAGLT